jgi:CubicO group peptidase (beta-lactamase class C family)
VSEVHGFCDERFAPIGEQFRGAYENGDEEGASYAVDVNGELAVDLWGGYRDLARTKPWEPDTLVRVASTTKVVTTIATLMLWDRGLIDLDEPIATYWPAFAQNGKATITTRQVLLHCAGVPGFGRAITLEDILDWDRMVAFTERARVWYEPGTRTGYQHITFGYILGELVQRVSGRSFVQFVADEITRPLGADFHFEVHARGDTARVAEVWFPPNIEDRVGPGDHGSLKERAEAEAADITEPLFVDPDTLPAVLPSGSGITNARALVRVGSIVSRCGEVDGRHYLSRQTVDETVREQSHAEDEVIGAWLRRGLFFALDDHPYHAPTPTAVHWGGGGGSWVTMDPASGITCAYTPSRYLAGDDVLIRQALQWQVLTDVLATRTA